MAGSIKEAAAAARAAVASGAAPTKLNEPKINDVGTGVIPQAGAAPMQTGGAKGPVVDPSKALEIVMLEDEEVEAELAREEAGKGGEAASGAAEEEGEEDGEPEGGAEGAAEGAAEEGAPEAEGAAGEPITVELPGIREGQAKVELTVDNPEAADYLRSLAKGVLRRQELARAQAAIDRDRENAEALEDALRIDPVNFIVERVHPQTKAEIAKHLLADPVVYQAVLEEFAGSEDPETLRRVQLKLENDRLGRQRNTAVELDRRTQIRNQGRELRQGIQRMIPDGMDPEDAQILAADAERDVSQYILAHRLRSLPTADLPRILERRLALYGITADEATQRLEDTDFAPLPLGARQPPKAAAAARRAPPARNGKEVLAAAERRRRAGAVPSSGGAGVAAAGIVLPRKQGVKARIQSMREFFQGS